MQVWAAKGATPIWVMIEQATSQVVSDEKLRRVMAALARSREASEVAHTATPPDRDESWAKHV